MTSKLTDKETDIVWHLSYGLTNADIGAQLDIAPDTVRSRLEVIATKLGTRGRAGIVGEAFRQGVLNASHMS